MEKQRKIRIFFSIILFIISIRNIMSVAVPFVIDDEFCYWSIGAFFNNLDWSGVTRYCAYYNWGYGIFLAILIKLTSNMVIAYRLAIILNGIWIVGAYNFMLSIGLKVCENKVRFSIANMLAFMGCLLPDVLSHTNITWPECFTFFICSVIIYNLVKFSYDNTIKNIYYFNYFVIVLYLIHQRFIGFLIATLILNIFLFVNKKIAKKDFIIFIGLIIAFICINIYIKNILINNLWLNGTNISGNNLSGQKEKIYSILFTKNGMIKLLTGILGQNYAIAVQTGLFAWWGIIFLLKYIWSYFVNKENLSKFIIYIYILMVYAFTIGICAVFLNERNQVDYIVYTRYISSLMQILLLIGGIEFFLNKEKKYKCFVIMSAGLLLISLLLEFTVNKENLNGFNMIAAVYLKHFNLLEIDFMLPALLAIVICSIIIILEKMNNYGAMYLCVICTAVNFYSIQMETDAGILSQTKIDFETASSVVDKINKNNSIYYLLENNFWKNRGKNIVQFLAPQVEIKALDENMLNDIDKKNSEVILWNNNKNVYNLLLSGMNCPIYDFESEQLLLFKSIYEQNKKDVSIDLKLMSLGEGVELEKDRIVQKVIEKEYSPIAFGPYICIDVGKYNASLELSLLESHIREDSLGYIVIRGKNGEYAACGIERTCFINEKGIIMLDFELNMQDSDFEIAVYSKGGIALQIDKILIKKLD